MTGSGKGHTSLSGACTRKLEVDVVETLAIISMHTIMLRQNMPLKVRFFLRFLIFKRRLMT